MGGVAVTPAVERTVVRFFRAVDTRDWTLLLDLLATRVRLDYVSLFGGEVETVAAGEVIARWQALLPGFDATQHVVGQLSELDGRVVGNVRAHHVIGEEEWLVAGWYELEVVEDRLAGITLVASYDTGGRELVSRARERAAG